MEGFVRHFLHARRTYFGVSRIGDSLYRPGFARASECAYTHGPIGWKQALARPHRTQFEMTVYSTVHPCVRRQGEEEFSSGSHALGSGGEARSYPKEPCHV